MLLLLRAEVRGRNAVLLQCVLGSWGAAALRCSFSRIYDEP